MPTTQRKFKPGRPPKYPWDRWLKRKGLTTLEKGKDFDCQVQSFVLMVYNQASRRNLKVSVSVDELKVKILVIPDAKA